MYIGLGLWCLTPFSTIIQLYREGTTMEKNGKKTQRNSRVHCYFFLIIGGVSIYGI